MNSHKVYSHPLSNTFPAAPSNHPFQSTRRPCVGVSLWRTVNIITFKSAEDLSKLPPDDPAFPIVEDLVKRLITDYIAEGYDYRPEDDGYTILIEEDDVDRDLNEIWDGCTLLTIPWEGIMLQGDFYIGIVLLNNQYGLCLVIPDAPWVNGELRTLIEDILDPLPTDTQEKTS